MRNGKTGVQLGDNTNIFDFTYVGNVAHAHLLAAQLLFATHKSAVTPLDHERVDGEAFIITNDSPCYFWDFTRSIWRAAGQSYKPGPAEKNVWTLSRTTASFIGVVMEIAASVTGSEATFTKQRATLATMTRYYNITKAKRVLGYEPRWTLPEGVDRSVAWFLEQDKKGVKAQ